MGTRKCILVVDDDPEWAECIQDLLGDAGYQVTVALDGRAGLEQVKKLRPVVVVTDVEMPVMSGLELLEHLRARGLRVPVVIATSDLETAQGPRLDGAFGIVAKTAPLEEMLDLVSRATNCKTPRRRWTDRRFVRRLRSLRLAAHAPAICLGVGVVGVAVAVLRRVVIG